MIFVIYALPLAQMFFYMEERNLYKLCPQGSHLTLVVPNIMLENLRGPEYDIHIYTCWEEIVVTSFSVTTMDTFQKGMWAQRKFCLWHDPAFLGSTRSPVLNEKQSIISKGQGGVEGEEKIPKGVRWGWETGKDFKGGGAGGEQKSKRKRKT